MRADTASERAEAMNGVPFIRIKSGRKIHFWDAETTITGAQSALVTGFSRGFKLAVAEGDPYYLEVLERDIDQVEEHMAALREYMLKLRGRQSQRKRIELLRNTTGRTPEEAEAFRAKADQLERELDG